VKTVYIGLGSNLGDRAANLREARKRLECPAFNTLRVSSVYETEPRDMKRQPWFLNQVLEAHTSYEPQRLLGWLLDIELAMGRKRTVAKGPRIIDLDILLYAGAIIHEPGLTVPHPHMTERRFVLEPLAELTPGLKHPAKGRTIQELLKNVKAQPVNRL
jgi:2-amino-4-hydroxy-6-hydroxymethyldihydropteridine diphosphokinase